jgi:hypothetical protein
LKKLSPKGEKIFEAVIMLTSITLAFIFWNSYLVYPVKLFVVLLHEMSHGIVTLCSGGTIKEIEISYEIGGSCISAGGNKMLIAISGYWGSLLFGSLMYLSALDDKVCKFTCCFFAFLLVITSLIFIRSLFGVLFSIGFSVILVLITMLPYSFFRKCVIEVLGMLSCFYILFDIKEDLLTTDYRNTDAMTLEKLTAIPSLLWGVIILILSLIVVFLLLRFSFRKLAFNKNN